MTENFPTLLKRILSKIELASLAISVIGFLLVYMGRTEGSNLLLVGMWSLAIVYFFTAFLPVPGFPATDSGEKSPKSFINLIPLLLWKAAYIASSVNVIALLFYMLHLKGYGQLLVIGTFVLFSSLLVSAFLISKKNEMFGILQSAITRSLMLTIIGLYILYTHWPPES